MKGGNGNDFKKLFDNQIQTLKERGCPEFISGILGKVKTKVLAKVAKIKIGKNHTPFLPVIPYNYITVSSQMGMVFNEGAVGYYNIGRCNSTSVNPFDDDLLSRPYYIFNINFNTRIKKLEEVKEKDKRRQAYLTGVEIIALATHEKEVLKNRIIGLNSYCREWGVAYPFLFLHTTGQPILGYLYYIEDESDKAYVIPSRDRSIVI